MSSTTPATFDANTTMQLVSDWLTKYGKDLKGICASDDSAQSLGIFQALVKEGKLFGITYQTAEGDGALSAKYAADWFNGKKMALRQNLAQHVITAKDVAGFYPPQW